MENKVVPFQKSDNQAQDYLEKLKKLRVQLIEGKKKNPSGSGLVSSNQKRIGSYPGAGNLVSHSDENIKQAGYLGVFMLSLLTFLFGTLFFLLMFMAIKKP